MCLYVSGCMWKGVDYFGRYYCYCEVTIDPANPNLQSILLMHLESKGFECRSLVLQAHLRL